MNAQGCLGIYLAHDKAVAVCLDSMQASAQIAACFDISVDHQSPNPSVELADKIAQLCRQHDLQFTHVALALDCSAYMQHDVHSNFSDKKQIESTLRFDTEEALATDISDVALAYNVLTSDEKGSAIRVFTSKKTVLAEIINAFAANNLDPVTVEPDVTCLCRFITKRFLRSEQSTGGALLAALSDSTGYLIGPLGTDSEDTIIQRTFLIAPGRDRNDILLNQLPLSIAVLGPETKPDKIFILDSAGSLQPDRISSALALPVELAEFSVPQDCRNAVAFAAACGAASSHLQKDPRTSFRADYMPYLGMKRRLEQTLKIISICTCVILAAVGLNLTFRLIQKNKPVKLLREKFASDYLTALPEKDKMPSKLTTAKNDLRDARNHIERIRKGQLSSDGEQSIPSRLTTVLKAFNAVASQTDLNIEKISITSKNITITGDTSNRSNTLKLLAEIKKSLNVQQENVGTQGQRDTFSITAELKTND